MQITETQKVAMFALRRHFISNMALVTRRRQQLLQQLHSVPQPMGIDHQELNTSHGVVDSITRQLQACVRQEDALLHEHVWAMVFQVR